ncbi:heavy metal translocating P-type ATPase metal-binding domain-containing protein [Pseudotenacibaculum sp. MALMAid0570]|uniref:heavy metal translocating P-type ATPase n=1 Tax=Pseudotenacibaculum sp. MALMAid0570 TaxID=3143938 RepID=UPI0032DF06F7
MASQPCFHCGTTCDNQLITSKDKVFCCFGCKTVYEILSENQMTCYYDLQNNPGAIPNEIKGKYDYLTNESIISKLLEFEEDNIHIVTLYIPHIHCSSCIWVLENLQRLNPNIVSSQVNFPKKTIRLHYNSKKTSLKEVVVLLASIGYEPYISLDDAQHKTKTVNRSIYYKLGVAGFAFGNIMFLSFPEYFEVSEFWLEKYKYVFRWLMLLFSLPVVFYAANDYFISAYKGLKSKILNIDVPIALGISVLFIRSTVEVVFDFGTGFFDSLSGLVFFLLLGKFFQQKTYNFLSFERDYKSYFPIAVTRIKEQKEENIGIYEVKKGDRLLIRNQELIPVDGILMSNQTHIDYSFVTGESKPVQKVSGDKIFAGGKQLEGAVEMEVLSSVSQSYLTQLWTNDVFNKENNSSFQSLTDSISKYFTIAVITIAVSATLFWLLYDTSKALSVFTAVLIIACPCAIALAAPFTLGNMLRIFGKHKFYVKNTQVLEQLAKIDMAVFDKTGTITSNSQNEIAYQGEELTSEQESILKSVLRNSNHPLSRKIYDTLETSLHSDLKSFKEVVGKGIQAEFYNNSIKVGSASFVNAKENVLSYDTSVHVSFNDRYTGKYTIKNSYREGVKKVFDTLDKQYELAILSGDNEGEKNYLKSILPEKTEMHFNQKPEHKLDYIQKHQEKNKHVMMVGDGLNDSGALAQSNIGISISEDINVFSPACDGILSAEKFKKIPLFLNLTKRSIKVIKHAFLLSLVYNVIGLYFAVTGQLSPVVAAILMPLSSISIVVFTTLATNIISQKLKK